MGYIIGIAIVIFLISLVVKIIIFLFSMIGEGVSTLARAVGPITLAITAILSVIAFFAFSWGGVLIVAICGLGIAFMLKKAGQAISVHDQKKKEIAQINQNTKQMDIKHNNQLVLQAELGKNCRWLGEMNSDMWRKKLPNFTNKNYETSFDAIVMNFAKQMEEQNILQSDDWFNIYLEQIVKSKSGKTAIQLINTVVCPQMQITHISSTQKMIKDKLEEYCNAKDEAVPAMLTKEAGETYWPSKYALKQYGLLEQNTSNVTTIELDEPL